MDENGKSNSQKECRTFIMPDEDEPHTATWLGYGATISTWGTSKFSGGRLVARKDIMRIAANISRFEHVKILVNESDLREAQNFLSEIKNEKTTTASEGKILPDIESGGPIEFFKYPVNDLWMRDIGPVFVHNDNKKIHAVNFNFNGWGQKDTKVEGWKKCPIKSDNKILDQRITEDQKVADFIIECTKVKKITTWLVLEGGGVEVNGKGTAICTESCILNDNRNPGKSKEEVEKELLRLLGIKKVIWLPGLKGKDITDGHVDFYARFVNDTKVVCSLENDKSSPDHIITHQNLKILSDSTDTFGNKISIISMVRPNFQKVKEAVLARNGWNDNKSFFNSSGFAAGYIGFYLANKCLLMTKFGDETSDKAAFDILSDIFPERTIMQITTDGISNGGGTIHCATQQQI